jgi:hypothetical protein
VLVIATVIVFAGLLNSQQTNWMHGRLAQLRDLRGAYAESKLGPYPVRNQFGDDVAYKQAIELYQHRYSDLWAAIARTYVDTAWVIRVPFFGFTFDVNDLGFLGGIGFLVILVCYRFCLTREVNNLRLSFDEAKKKGKDKLEELYNLLAMRQVFTVPTTEHIQKTQFLVITPKLIPWFSVTVYCAVLRNDFATRSIGSDLERTRYHLLMAFEIVVAFFLVVLAWGITRRLVRMDGIWDEYWTVIREASVTEEQIGDGRVEAGS